MTAPRQLMGAGLFDLRSLSTGTLLQLYDVVHAGGKAETRLFSMIRRILIERGAL